MSYQNLDSIFNHIHYNPLFLVTNPHGICKDNKENLCDQISNLRTKQFIIPDNSFLYRNIEFIFSKERPILGMIPRIHRSIIDFNRNKSENTYYSNIFQNLLDKYPNIVVIDIHSYPKNTTWGKNYGPETNLDLVILYPPKINEKNKEILKELKDSLNSYNVIFLIGGENFLINTATEKNHLALLLEFPDEQSNDRSKELIDIIFHFLKNKLDKFQPIIDNLKNNKLYL